MESEWEWPSACNKSQQSHCVRAGYEEEETRRRRRRRRRKENTMWMYRFNTYYIETATRPLFRNLLKTELKIEKKHRWTEGDGGEKSNDTFLALHTSQKII
jgi:hypothetical protein